MRVDLHNHTTLCNHAVDTMDEYVQRAIELGIDYYGFSEHAPMKNFCDGYRLPLDKKEFYENSVLELKEKYKNDIDILLGYEVDFIEGDYFLDEILNAKVDYLIGSVHYLDKWGFDNPEFISEYNKKDIDTIWEEYFDAVKMCAKIEQIDIIGHFDLMKVFKFMPKKDIKVLAKDALTQIKNSNKVIEINPAGLRKPVKEQYPSRPLLELCFEMDIPITFGSDAHSKDQVGFGYDEVIKLAKDIGYTNCVLFKNKEKEFIKF
ncbi:MAG: histidinol-phosphatase [Campylobacterota bacterium]|nr:histidinol-phosphatase [Campylobacterota bacterium]